MVDGLQEGYGGTYTVTSAVEISGSGDVRTGIEWALITNESSVVDFVYPVPDSTNKSNHHLLVPETSI